MTGDVSGEKRAAGPTVVTEVFLESLVTAATSADAGGGFVPNQLAMLVPTFDPAKDDLTVYSQKVSLLLASWPEGKYNELATRLILGCSGSAFNKLQIHASEVTQNDRKSIQRRVVIGDPSTSNVSTSTWNVPCIDVLRNLMSRQTVTLPEPISCGRNYWRNPSISSPSNPT